MISEKRSINKNKIANIKNRNIKKKVLTVLCTRYQ